MDRDVATEQPVDAAVIPASLPGSSPYFPLMLLALAFGAWVTFQTVMLYREHVALSAAHAGQERQVEESKKVREALDNVARDTAKLASGGNANAKLIVDELRKRGVTINPDAPPPGK